MKFTIYSSRPDSNLRKRIGLSLFFSVRVSIRSREAIKKPSLESGVKRLTYLPHFESFSLMFLLSGSIEKSGVYRYTEKADEEIDEGSEVSESLCGV